MESWELALPFPRAARVRAVTAPALGILLSLALAGAGAVSLGRGDLYVDQRIESWFLVGAGLVAAVVAARVAGRRLAALRGGIPFLRVDPAALGIRHERRGTWLVMTWQNVRAVDLRLLEPPADHPHAGVLQAMRVLRFVPYDEAEVPDAPPSLLDDLLDLSPAAARLAVVVDGRADESLTALLAWMRAEQPGIPVSDHR